MKYRVLCSSLLWVAWSLPAWSEGSLSDRVINALAGEPLWPSSSEECTNWYDSARQRCDQQQREWDACWSKALDQHMDPFQADRECKSLEAGSCYETLGEKQRACYTRVDEAKKAAQQAIRDGATGNTCDGKDVECLNAMQGAHSGALLMNGATPGVKGIQQGAAAVLHGQQNQMNMEAQRATTELDRAMTIPSPEAHVPGFQPSPPPKGNQINFDDLDKDLAGLQQEMNQAGQQLNRSMNQYNRDLEQGIEQAAVAAKKRRKEAEEQQRIAEEQARQNRESQSAGSGSDITDWVNAGRQIIEHKKGLDLQKQQREAARQQEYNRQRDEALHRTAEIMNKQAEENAKWRNSVINNRAPASSSLPTVEPRPQVDTSADGNGGCKSSHAAYNANGEYVGQSCDQGQQ